MDCQSAAFVGVSLSRSAMSLDFLANRMTQTLTCLFTMTAFVHAQQSWTMLCNPTCSSKSLLTLGLHDGEEVGAQGCCKAAGGHSWLVSRLQHSAGQLLSLQHTHKLFFRGCLACRSKQHSFTNEHKHGQ